VASQTTSFLVLCINPAPSLSGQASFACAFEVLKGQDDREDIKYQEETYIKKESIYIPLALRLPAISVIGEDHQYSNNHGDRDANRIYHVDAYAHPS
jgi:hypothetical protein